MYFFFVFAVILLYIFVQTSRINESKKRSVFCFCAFLVILFVSIFKDDTIFPDLVSDRGGYIFEFETIASLDGLREFFVSYFVTGGYFHEIGWSLLNFLVSRFTNSFEVFQIIVSICICAGYSYGIFKLSRNPLFSFLFIMLYPTALFQSFYVLRQHLATALFFLLVPAVVEKKYKKVLFVLPVVISLHYSAAILLPFLVFIRLGNKLFSFKKLVFAALLVFGFAFLLNHLTYERYADRLDEEQGNALALILTGGVLLVYLLSCRLNNNKVQRQQNKNDTFITAYMLYSVIICFACLGTATGRLTNYFTIFLANSVPFAVARYSTPIRLSAYFVFILYCIAFALLSERGLFQYQLAF